MTEHAVLTARDAAECIVDQGWERYTPEDHAVWGTLFERQLRTLRGHVALEYLDGLATLGIDEQGVPDFQRMNARLRRATGWEVVAVPGLIPSRPFFQMLANRQFPAGTFIRTREQLDYLEEPDIFHDVFSAMCRCSRTPPTPTTWPNTAASDWRRWSGRGSSSSRGSTGTPSSSG